MRPSRCFILAPKPVLFTRAVNIDCSDYEDEGSMETTIAEHPEDEYLSVLGSDVISSAQQLVMACWASGQCHKDFKRTIKEGNAAGDFGEDGLHAISKFLHLPKYESSIGHHKLSPTQRKVLDDIRHFLSLPHTVQEVVSAEKTPTLTVVLPAYEWLIHVFKLLAKWLPKIAPAIDASIQKLNKYLSKTQTTRIYAIAMILNLTVKHGWLEKNWTTQELTTVKKWIKDAMLEYQKVLQNMPGNAPGNLPLTARTTIIIPTASHASHTQGAGFARLDMIARALSDESVGTSDGLSTPPINPKTPLSPEEQEAANLADDKQIVAEELQQYLDDRVISVKELEDFDILRYWQASSVPSEQVFSSSKESDTMRRSQISPVMMEILQILKFIFRAERLDFNDDWIAVEEELCVINIPPDILKDMISSRRITELLDMLDE
ncbi:hypothetical protein BD779DRAFT_1478372 [Infundibulicybe gibba]|nr:hypothetical protein BD779DRAFT_1478372 [Infundibulicybe gibba]